MEVGFWKIPCIMRAIPGNDNYSSFSSTPISCSTPTKSALMLGLGEEMEEVRGALRELLGAGCRRVVIGQYIPPSASAWPVSRWVAAGEFATLADEAREMGFANVLAAPLARSS